MFTNGWQLKFFLNDINTYLSELSDSPKDKKVKSIFLREALSIHIPKYEWAMNGQTSEGETKYWIANDSVIVDIFNQNRLEIGAAILPQGIKTHISNIDPSEINLETFLYMSKISSLVKKWKLTDEFLYWQEFHISVPSKEDFNPLDVQILSTAI